MQRCEKERIVKLLNINYIISNSFEGKNLFERIDMTLKAESDVRNRYIAPMDVLLKTPQEYNYSKKAYFNSEIII